MKFSKFYILAILLFLVGCGYSVKSNDSDSLANMDSVALSAQSQNNPGLPDDMADSDASLVEEAQLAMLQDLFSSNGGEDEMLLRKYCTQNALKQLNSEYEYDDYDENSLAVWAINGRPYSDLEMVLASLRKTGPDTYRAVFKFNSGEENEGSSVMEYKLADENGQWKIDGYKQVSLSEG